jgi:hypothetical protein
MTTHRISRATAALSAAMASVLSLTACGSPDPSDPASTDEAAVRASRAAGVDVFRGVMFGSGSVGAKLSIWTPEARAQASAVPPAVQITRLETAIAQMNAAGWSSDAVAQAQAALDMIRKGGALPSADAKMQAIQEDFIVKQIGTMDPTFFDRFGAEMQSGNPVRVDAAFKEANTLLHAIVSAPAPSVYVVPPNYWHPPHGGGGGGSVAGPVAIAVAIAWVVVVFWVIGVQGDANTRLGHDQLVGKLADELRAS